MSAKSQEGLAAQDAALAPDDGAGGPLARLEPALIEQVDGALLRLDERRRRAVAGQQQLEGAGGGVVFASSTGAKGEAAYGASSWTNQLLAFRARHPTLGLTALLEAFHAETRELPGAPQLALVGEQVARIGGKKRAFVFTPSPPGKPATGLIAEGLGVAGLAQGLGYRTRFDMTAAAMAEAMVAGDAGLAPGDELFFFFGGSGSARALYGLNQVNELEPVPTSLLRGLVARTSAAGVAATVVLDTNDAGEALDEREDPSAIGASLPERAVEEGDAPPVRALIVAIELFRAGLDARVQQNDWMLLDALRDAGGQEPEDRSPVGLLTAAVETIDRVRDGSIPPRAPWPGQRAELHEIFGEAVDEAGDDAELGAVVAKMRARAGDVRAATSGEAAPGGVRTALVVANHHHYDGSGGTALRGMQMGVALNGLGFAVEARSNLRASELQEALVTATAAALPGDDVAIYYIGPGDQEALTAADGQPVSLAWLDRARADGASRGFRVTTLIDARDEQNGDVALQEDDEGRVSGLRPVESATPVAALPEDDAEILALVTMAEGMRLAEMPSSEVADALARAGGPRLPTATQEQRQALHDALVAMIAQKRRDLTMGATTGEGRVRLVGSTEADTLAADSNSFGDNALDKKAAGAGGDTTEALVTEQRHFKKNAGRGNTQKGTVAGLGGAQGTVKKALVVGNWSYMYQSSLMGVMQDGPRAAAALRGDGYDVDFRENLTGAGLRQALREAMARLVRGDKGTFFYAGHGTALGLLGIDDATVSNAEVGRAAKGPRERGAEVTVIADSCKSGSLVQEGAAAVQGDDHLPVLTRGKGDDGAAAQLITVGNSLRDAYLVMSGGGTYGLLSAAVQWFTKLVPGAKLAARPSIPELAQAHAQLVARLREVRAERDKRAYLDGE